MAKPTKKQIACTADQLARAQHYLSELNLPYALVLEGIPKIFTNGPARHAVIILRDALELADKVQELRIEDEAMKLADRQINLDEGGVKG